MIVWPLASILAPICVTKETSLLGRNTPFGFSDYTTESASSILRSNTMWFVAPVSTIHFLMVLQDVNVVQISAVLAE